MHPYVTFAACVIAFALAAPSVAVAQMGPAELGVELSGHAGVIIPFGDLAERTGVPIGVMAGARYEVVPDLSASLRVGAFFGIPSRTVTSFEPIGELVANSSVNLFPIWLGVDYATPVERLGAHAELGISFMDARAEGSSLGSSVSRNSRFDAFTFTVGGSYDLAFVRPRVDLILANIGGEELFPGLMLGATVPVWIL